jgi:N-acetylglucosaminyldiphosphoundecaprenol N-acetyl-beta-D-mannosaminyltransferase
MARAGLEWLHRLGHEPRRLWRRYLVDDAAFVPILVRTVLRRGGAGDADVNPPRP